MKLLHISDLHVGKHLNEFSLLDDQRFILQRIVDIIKEQRVDALLIAGDIYDKSTPSAEAVALLDWFLNAVAETGAACFAISGNHDSAERVAYAARLLAARRIYLSPVFAGSLASFQLEDEHGPVTFWLMPFIKPAHVRPHFPDADIGTDYTAACKAVLDACDVCEKQRNVLLAHQFVTCSSAPTERTDSELILGGLDNVDASVFDRFDYVALGHVHRPQRVGRDEVRYSGSPLKYSFSEARFPKTAPLVELGPKGQLSIELIPLEPLHDVREVRGPLAELTSPGVLEALTERERQDYLHVTLTDPLPPMNAMAKLRAAYPHVMALDFDNARTAARGALADGERGQLDEASPLELFARFYEKQNGEPLSERQRALAIEALEEMEEQA